MRRPKLQLPPAATHELALTPSLPLRRQAVEVLDGYRLHGYDNATIDEVKQWGQAGGSCGEVCWQDLSLRTHRNVRTGDCVHEWNYVGRPEWNYGRQRLRVVSLAARRPQYQKAS